MTATQTITDEQLQARAGELGRCELIRGEITDMTPPGGSHGLITMEIAFAVRAWAQTHGGNVYAAETGFVLERNPDTVRAPDVAYISAQRLDEARTPKYIPIPPDFVAEVLSPSDKADAVDQKVQWWLDHGVKLVWVADPANRSVTSYRPDGRAHLYRHDDVLSGEDVMPGLSVPIREIFVD